MGAEKETSQQKKCEEEREGQKETRKGESAETSKSTRRRGYRGETDSRQETDRQGERRDMKLLRYHEQAFCFLLFHYVGVATRRVKYRGIVE